MSDLNVKTVPLAAVVYVVRFDGRGRPLREAGFYIEQSGATHVEGGAASSLEALLAATRACMRATVGMSMQEVFEEREKAELLKGTEADRNRSAAEIDERSEPEGGAQRINVHGPLTEELPAAGEVF